MADHPFPASALAIDLRGFSSLTNPEQLASRGAMYRLLTEAFTASGVPWSDCTHEDRGDGVLVVVPVSVPKTTLLGPVLRRLTDPDLDWPRRVRIALHAGDIHHDGRGFVGSDINHVFRLLDSEVLHAALDRTVASCAVLISDSLHRGIVRHGYHDIDPHTYFPVVVEVKETTAAAWLHIPGDERTAEQISRTARTRSTTTRHSAGVTLMAGGNQVITGNTIAGRNIGSPGRRTRRG